MKLVCFADCLPSEVHKQLFDCYWPRVSGRVTNECYLAYLELFAQLGYEVHSVVSDFARPAIRAAFQGSDRDPHTGINFHYINTDGPTFLRLLKKIVGNYRVLKKFQRELQSGDQLEPLVIVNHAGQVMYAVPCFWFRRSRFAKNWRGGVQYLAIMSDYPIEHSNVWWLNFLSKIQWYCLKGADALLLESEVGAREIFAPRIGANRAFAFGFPLTESLIQQYRSVEPPIRDNSESQFTVVYTGLFSMLYLFDRLVDTIRLAETKCPGKYRWQFAGWGTDCMDQLEELAALPGFDVELLGALDATELIKLQKSADVLISFRRNSTSLYKQWRYEQWNRIAYSTKLFDYLLAARPILTTDVPAIEPGMRPFLNLIDSEEPEDILAAIERVCEHPPSQELLEQGRDYVIEHHSTSAVAGELKPILDRIGVKYR
jgi:hypothetical protein